MAIFNFRYAYEIPLRGDTSIVNKAHVGLFVTISYSPTKATLCGTVCIQLVAPVPMFTCAE